MPGLAPGDGLSPTAPVGVRVVRIHLPLRHPHVTAHGEESVRDVLLVRCTGTDGTAGWGECPTLSERGYSGETTDDAWSALVEGGSPGPMASGALADARLDAELKGRGERLVERLAHSLGPPAVSSRRRVPFGSVLGLDRTPSSADGFVKLKITPATVARLREVRATWPGLRLAADANGSFGSAEEVPEWIDDVGLAYLEQPLAAEDLAGHAELRAGRSTPIALDESVGSVEDLVAAARLGAVDLVSVKPARLGGLAAAVDLVRAARRLGIGTFVGGMLETGVGRAGAVALAAVVTDRIPTDLGPSARYFDHDVAGPITEADGELVVPEGPGNGIEPDVVRLDEVTVADAELHRRHRTTS